MIKRSLPFLALVFSVLSLVLVKISYSSWLVNDGIYTNISEVYANGIRLFPSSEVENELSFVSGNGFGEDKAIFVTLSVAMVLSILSVVIALISIYLRQNRQFSSIAASLGVLSLGLIVLAVK